ncbi:hypothetical protein [Priestia megaterium]|nr:hypothetical protein [Priestia megaterium]
MIEKMELKLLNNGDWEIGWVYFNKVMWGFDEGWGRRDFEEV